MKWGEVILLLGLALWIVGAEAHKGRGGVRYER